jgi:hypothetical protein
MAFIKHIISFFKSLYIVTLSLVVILVFGFLVFIYKIQLDESVSTWVFSSSMQTLGALIALLPISYAYFINNLDNENSNMLDSYVIDQLKRDVYFDLMIVISYCFTVILVNLGGFIFMDTVDLSLVVIFMTIEGVGLIAFYILRLFNPNKVNEILKQYDTSTGDTDNQQSISLDSYITEYLELEKQVKDFLSNENDNSLVDNLPLYDIVDVFSKDFEEISENYDSFKEIIFHRNNLIHNYSDTNVDYSKYLKILELNEVFLKNNNAFITKKVFANILSVKNTIEKSLKEYLLDMQNRSTASTELAADFKEDVVSLLHSYFISDYYTTLSLEEADEADFEITQNNYSERKLVGIDIKSIKSKNITTISSSFFARLKNKFMYLVLINYDPANNSFTIIYQTKDKEVRSTTIK